jgi:hypothetical protein
MQSNGVEHDIFEAEAPKFKLSKYCMYLPLLHHIDTCIH